MLSRTLVQAVLVFCAVTAGLVAPTVIREGFFSLGADAAANGPVQGSRLSVPGLDFSQGTNTVVVFLRSSCQYCIKSMDFYRVLAAKATTTSHFRLVVVGSEPVDSVNRFLREHQLKPDEVIPMHTVRVSISATPTLVLVNERGIIVRSWVGEMGPAARELLLQALHGAR